MQMKNFKEDFPLLRCLYPNNLQDVPQWELDWLKNVPTAWEDVYLNASV